MRGKQIAVLYVGVAALLLAFLLSHAFSGVNRIPRASKYDHSPLPTALYDFETLRENCQYPLYTRTNHMLKLRYVSAAAVQTWRDVNTMTFIVEENLSDSAFQKGDLLYFTTGEHDCCYLFENVETVYCPLPVYRTGADSTDIIDGTVYYHFPGAMELFFVYDGKIYPYRDITYAVEYGFEELKDCGNPYAQYEGMEEAEFVETILPLLKNPRA